MTGTLHVLQTFMPWMLFYISPARLSPAGFQIHGFLYQVAAGIGQFDGSIIVPVPLHMCALTCGRCWLQANRVQIPGITRVKHRL